MALLDRVKERIETDLTDAELQSMIDGITAEIELRFGVNAAIAVTLNGNTEFITLARPMDTGEASTLTEVETRGHGLAASQTVLAADDYRVHHGGRTLQRLRDGTNGREVWAPEVQIDYTPVTDAAQRQDATIRLVQLDVQNRGLASEKVGDWQATFQDLSVEREKILTSLSPRAGLVMA